MTLRQRFALWLGFAVHVVLSFHEIAQPFLYGHHGWNASLRSMIGRNYLDIGWIATRLLPYKPTWPVDVPEGPIHWNHPPTINILTGLSFEIFGQHEWAAELVVVIPSLLMFWVWFVWGRRISPTLGIAAAWVFALSPLQIEFGNMLNYEIPIVLLSMLAALALFDAPASGSPSLSPATAPSPHSTRRAALGIALMVGAVAIDWSACFLAAAMGVALLLEKRWKTFLVLGVTTSACAGALFLWLNANSSDGGLVSLGMRRASGVPWLRLAEVVGNRFVSYIGWPIIVLALVGLVAQVRRRKLDPVLVTFALGTTIYFSVFKNAAVIHNFYIVLFLPAFVACAAYGMHAIGRVTDWIGPRAIAATLAVCVLAVGLNSARSWHTLRLKSWEITDKRPARGAPWDGRLNEYLVMKWLHDHSKRSDTIAMLPSIRPTVQARYYLHRKILRTRSLEPKGARYVVVAEREVPKKTREVLDQKYRIIRGMKYWIVDTQGPKEADVELIFTPKPWTWQHWYFVSAMYPPYELVERQKSVAAGAKLK
ncbi:MAG: glycosyltransferase family 39 protein [bacterium]